MTFNVKHIIFAQFALAAFLAPSAHAMRIVGSNGCLTISGEWTTNSQIKAVAGGCTSPSSWWSFNNSQLVGIGTNLQTSGESYCVVPLGTTSGSLVIVDECGLYGSETWFMINSQYQIVNLQSGLCLDDAGGSSAQLQLNSCTGSFSQIWYTNAVTFVAGNGVGGYCVGTQDGQAAAKTAVELVGCYGLNNTLWQDANGGGQITGIGTELNGTKSVSRCLTATGHTAGSPVVINSCSSSPDLSQEWSIQAYYYSLNASYMEIVSAIKVDGNNMCLDSTTGAKGTQLVINPCASGVAANSQTWAVF